MGAVAPPIKKQLGHFKFPTCETGGDYSFALCPSVYPSLHPSPSFFGLFFAMFSHNWMKVGSKLPYKDLQIKFNFRHGWPSFSWVIAFVQKSFSALFLAMLSYIWRKVGRKLPYKELQIKFETSNIEIKTQLMDEAIPAVLYLRVHQNNGCRFQFVGVGGGPVLL